MKSILKKKLKMLLKQKNYLLESIFHLYSDNFYVPVMYPELSSHRILTMEYIDGIKVSDKEKLKEMGFDHVDVANTIIQHLSDMIFVYGFVHMDPHAGIII